MRIRDFVDVRGQPTVVRLDHLDADDSDWISQSYYITDEVDRHLKALRHLMDAGQGRGVFLIGHYGSGKSHFLAYLIQQLKRKEFVEESPEIIPVSLLNYSADAALEQIVAKHLPTQASSPDRRQLWDQVASKHDRGTVILLDELSEFLRSKPDNRLFNEDVRYLQFLGEWAMNHKLWIVASLQEQIEHTGELEYDLYRKIKDRYPLRLILSPAHVKDLIAKWILEKKPGYDQAVDELARSLKKAFPDLDIDFTTFCSTYPIHPATLELLEEVRDRFSQARGIVDFVVTQLGGDVSRNVSPTLDADWGELICPDRIIDHFSDLFDIQAEFLPMAQKLLPYYRRHLPELFHKDSLQKLARRLINLLVLVHLAPRRAHLSVKDATAWILHQVTTIDPKKNIAIIGKILDTLHREGAYVAKTSAGFSLDLKDDSRDTVDRLLARELTALRDPSDIVLEELVPLMEAHSFNPFELSRDTWQTKTVDWHFHSRDVWVYFGNGTPGALPRDAQVNPEIQIGIPWGDQTVGGGRFLLQPKPIQLDSETLELVALRRLRQRPLDRSAQDRIDERIKTRAELFRSRIASAYSNGRFLDPNGEPQRFRPMSQSQQMTQWLQHFGEIVLRRRFPRFEKFAPSHGPLPKEAYRQLMGFLETADLGNGDAPEFVKLIREAYLVPMGLMRRSGRDYRVIGNLEKHELVTLIQPMLEHNPVPKRVYQQLSAPVYGLVADQIHLLLITLLSQGEIDIVKGGKSYRSVYPTLIYPIQYDRITKGKALNLQQLRDLEAVCREFDVTLPKTWSVMAQKRCARALRTAAEKLSSRIQELRMRLEESCRESELVKRIDDHLDRWAALHKGQTELHGIQHFLFEISSPQRFIQETRELEQMTDQLESRKRALDRFIHLLSHEIFKRADQPAWMAKMSTLAPPPRLDQWDETQTWLEKTGAAYDEYMSAYAQAHDQWWRDIAEHLVWTYSPPNLCHSDHLSLDNQVRELTQVIDRARTKRCTGLANLNYSPVCHCQFDGWSAPIAQDLARADTLMADLDQALCVFFQQEKVKNRMHQWVDDLSEVNAQTMAYLDGHADYPEIEDISLLDQFLSGIELVETADPRRILDIIGERVWHKKDLLDAVDRALTDLGPRFKFVPVEEAKPSDVLTWCVEQCLRSGTPLPDGFTNQERATIAGLIEADWVAPASLEQVESLNLGDDAVDVILKLVATGTVAAPKAPAAHSVMAALDFYLCPPEPRTPDDLADVTAILYRHADRLVKINKGRYLKTADRLASWPLDPQPPKLVSALKSVFDHQWVLIDCLGLPLLDAFLPKLPEWLPSWETTRLTYGRVSNVSDTRRFYDEVIEADLVRQLIKIDVVDQVIHHRQGSFVELCQIAQAELSLAMNKLTHELDRTLPLAIFADHGFRLNKTGSRFVHGGSSTLERTVPLLILKPITSSLQRSS